MDMFSHKKYSDFKTPTRTNNNEQTHKINSIPAPSLATFNKEISPITPGHPGALISVGTFYEEFPLIPPGAQSDPSADGTLSNKLLHITPRGTAWNLPITPMVSSLAGTFSMDLLPLTPSAPSEDAQSDPGSQGGMRSIEEEYSSFTFESSNDDFSQSYSIPVPTVTSISSSAAPQVTSSQQPPPSPPPFGFEDENDYVVMTENAVYKNVLPLNIVVARKSLPPARPLMPNQNPEQVVEEFVQPRGENLQGKQYVCDDCGKKYSSSIKLAEHKITHKPLVCSYCGKMYKCYSAMRYHYKTCHGQKNIRCDVCNQVFKAEETLKVHKKTGVCDRKLNGKTFSCNECDKVFKTSANMRRHKKDKH